MRPQALDCLGQKGRREIEGAHRHRGRPQETGGVRVAAVDVGRGLAQAPEYGRGLSERVGVGLNGKDPDVG